MVSRNLKKNYGKNMAFRTLRRDQQLHFTCLQLTGVKKALMTYLDCLQQGLTALELWRNPEPSPQHTRLHKTQVGRRPLLLRKPSQENKVLHFMLHPVVTGSLYHLFKAKEQFLCLNV